MRSVVRRDCYSIKTSWMACQIVVVDAEHCEVCGGAVAFTCKDDNADHVDAPKL